MNNYTSAYRLIKNAYDPASRDLDHEMDFIRARVYRPLSFGLTVPFVCRGWSANEVTWLRVAIVAVGFCLLMLGQYWSVILGAIMCLAHVFLDYVDGNLARVRGPSYFGGFLDEITDVAVKIFTPVAVSVGLYVRPDRLLESLAVEPFVILLIGVVTALASAAKAYINAEFAQREQAFVAGHRTPPASLAIESLTDGRGISLQYIYRTGVSLMLVMMPLFATADLLSAYLLLIFLSRTMTFPLELVQLIRRARRTFAEN